MNEAKTFDKTTGKEVSPDLNDVMSGNSEEGLMLTFPDGRIFDCNPAACNLYGFTLDEMTKLNLKDITVDTEGIKSEFDKGIIQIPGSYHKKKDGTSFPVEISKSPFKLNNENFNVIYVRDITDKIKIQNQLIHDASFPKLNPNPVFEIDFLFNVTLCNPVAQQIIKLMGAEDASIFFPEDLEEILKTLRQDNSKLLLREVSVNELYFEEKITFAPGFETIRFYCRDITNQKKVEKALRLIEANFKEAQNLAKIGDYRFDIESGIIKWSDELFNIFGRDKKLSEPGYTELERLYTQESWDLHNKVVERAIQFGEPYNVEFELIRADNQKHRWLNVIGKVEKNNEGKVVALFGTAQDITERKEAEKRANETYQLYRVIFENSEEGLLLTSPDGRIFDANPAATRILGFSREEIISLGRNGVIDPSDPGIREYLEKRLKDGYAVGELMLLCKDGTKKQGEITSRIFYNEKGEPFTSMIFRDVTERKRMQDALIKSEKEFRTLFEILPVGVSIVDENRNILKTNPAFENVLKMSPEYISQNYHKKRKYIRSDYTPMLPEEFPSNISIKEQIAVHDKEVGIIDKDEDIFWLNVSSAPLSNSSAVIVSVDITDRKNADKIILESEAKLKEAQKLAKIGNWSWELETGELKWSDELFNITGRDKNIKPPSFEETRSYYTAESLILRNEAVKRSMELGVSTSYDAEMIRFDNKEHIWVQTIIKVEKDGSGKVKSLFGTAQDITERKIVENKLKQAEKNWRETFNAISDHICLLDKNGTILQCNSSMSEAFNPPGEKMVGRKCFELMHDCKSFVHTCPYVDMMRSGKRETNEQVINGKYHSVTVDPILNEKGEIQGAVHIMRDISERKKAEEQLKRTSLYVRGLIEATLDPLVTISPSGKITDVNQATENATGLKREQLIGTDFSSYFIDSEKARKGYQKVLKDGIVRDYPLTIRHESGKTIDVSYNAVVYRNDKGQLQGVFAAARDITEMKLAEFAMKESEKKYRTLFEEAVDGIAMMDSQTLLLTDCNKALCNMLEMDKNELINKPHSILHPDNDEFMKSLDLKKTPLIKEHILETKIITKKGVIKDIEIKASNLKLKDKKFTLGIFRDVTARKKIEKQLVDSQNQLRELAHHIQSVREEERKGLSRSLHDNFGQSLTGLKMGIFSLKKKLLKLDEMSGDNEIFGNINSMITLIDELIILTGKLSMDLRPNVLDMLGIKAAIDWLVNDYSNKSEIKFKLSSKIESIDLNPEYSTEVFRILQEALTNVIRHAKATRVTIEISAENDNYFIAVKDNGRGITENEIKSLLSMGILSMRERAKLFGGDIELSGKKGKGTTLLIKIPISKK